MTSLSDTVHLLEIVFFRPDTSSFVQKRLFLCEKSPLVDVLCNIPVFFFKHLTADKLFEEVGGLINHRKQF